jgi:glutathione S-transferase
MGDAGEGLVDADARIQQRLEEHEQERRRRLLPVKDPDRQRTLESLRLAKTELQQQFAATIHAVRREQIQQALAELDRRMGELGGGPA